MKKVKDLVSVDYRNFTNMSTVPVLMVTTFLTSTCG